MNFRGVSCIPFVNDWIERSTTIVTLSVEIDKLNHRKLWSDLWKSIQCFSYISSSLYRRAIPSSFALYSLYFAFHLIVHIITFHLISSFISLHLHFIALFVRWSCIWIYPFDVWAIMLIYPSWGFDLGLFVDYPYSYDVVIYLWMTWDQSLTFRLPYLIS